MRSDTVIAQGTMEWAVASRAAPDESACGDLHLVQPAAEGVLLAVVDGLGHGQEALAAAQTAVRTLEQHAEQPLHALVQRCHEALTRTRGVVMTLAMVRPLDGRLAWLGVGNVEAALWRAGRQGEHPAERVLLRSGVVGYQLPPVQARALPIAPGDLLVFATDGIGAGFVEGVTLSDSPQQIADGILKRHFKGYDDALVLAVRYVRHRHE